MIRPNKLISVYKLGKITAEEEMKMAESIGNVPKPTSERQKEVAEKWGDVLGMVRVTEGGLFGHKETLDWHANRPSDPNRCSLIWLYAVKGSKGSLTSWIDNHKSYLDLPDDIKEQCKKVKFTTGFKRGTYTDDTFFKEHHNKELIYDLVQTNKMGLTGLFFPFNQIMQGVPKELFEYLKKHILQDKYRYDHYWEDGDLVISEQWLTIHKRHAYEKMNERLLHRIAID